MLWLSHIAGTNRMMVFVPGSLNKLKLPKVKLKLQVKVLSFIFFLRGKCTETLSFDWSHTVSYLHSLLFVSAQLC